MARKKAGGIEIEGFDELVNKLHQVNADIEKITEQALKETHRLVTNKALAAIEPHSVRFSGDTKKSLVKQPKVILAGSAAYVKTGFNIDEGGLPSIFLMYGSPTTDKDQNLYNAFYGKKTKDEIRKIQEDIFYGELRKLGG